MEIVNKVDVKNGSDGFIKIPECKVIEDALPYRNLSNISEIIIYSSCIKVVINSFKAYTFPIYVEVPEDLPKLHSVVSYNGGYQTICAYSFNDTIYALDNDSLQLPTRNLAVYFNYSDPVVYADNVIIHRKERIPICKLDDFNNELSKSESESFHKCLTSDMNEEVVENHIIDQLNKMNNYPLYVPASMVEQVRKSFEDTLKNYDPDKDIIGFKDGSPVTKKDLKQIKYIEW